MFSHQIYDETSKLSCFWVELCTNRNRIKYHITSLTQYLRQVKLRQSLSIVPCPFSSKISSPIYDFETLLTSVIKTLYRNQNFTFKCPKWAGHNTYCYLLPITWKVLRLRNSTFRDTIRSKLKINYVNIDGKFYRERHRLYYKNVILTRHNK